MAAGMGSRFGGLKQLTPVGPNGEFLIDYSIYDAMKAGVREVVFVIRREMEQMFLETIGKRLKQWIPVTYVFQELSDIPISVMVTRKKPWGTGQALLAARDVVSEPFIVINADDFYGCDAFLQLGNFLNQSNQENCYGMVGYSLENTLSKYGSVSRGICSLEGGFLKKIEECTKIERQEHKIVSISEGKRRELSGQEVVSVNLFGFRPSIFAEAQSCFQEFLADQENLEHQEFYLPSVVQRVIDEGKEKVLVLSTTSSFAGMTYLDDLENLKEYIKVLIENEIYPEKLWEGEVL